MSAERYSLDTNILIYAVDCEAGERHLLAMDILDRAVDEDCVLALQVLAEFFHAVTRKGKMPPDEAAGQVADWQLLFPVVLPRPETLQQAIAAVTTHRLSFWDAMLWATLRPARVSVLLSEDFQDGRSLDGLAFHNPFHAPR